MNFILIVFSLAFSFYACASREIEVIVQIAPEDTELLNSYNAGSYYLLAIFDARTQVPLFDKYLDGRTKQVLKNVDDLPTGAMLKIELQVQDAAYTTYLVGELSLSDSPGYYIDPVFGPVFSLEDGEIIQLYLTMRAM